MVDKFEINLLEENEIEFGVKIEGTDSELGASKPKVRFTITEEKSGKGWIFITEKNEKNNFVATIPSLKGTVSESENYKGKLEIILGNKYFTPTEVDVKFIEPLKIESVIVNNNSSTRKASASNDDLLVESIILKKSKPELSYGDLNDLQKEKVNKIFIEKCSRLGIKSPLKALKEGTEAEKSKLRELINSSVKTYLNN